MGPQHPDVASSYNNLANVLSNQVDLKQGKEYHVRALAIRQQTLGPQHPGGRVGLVVRALAFHQCGPGSISALGVIRGLSLLVLYSAMRGFPPGTPVFPSHQKPTFDLI